MFSVIGPEAGSAILYRDASRAPELTRDLRMTAPGLLRLAVVDAVVPETVPAVRAAVADALSLAQVGDRVARPERATRRAVKIPLRPTRVFPRGTTEATESTDRPHSKEK